MLGGGVVVASIANTPSGGFARPQIRRQSTNLQINNPACRRIGRQRPYRILKGYMAGTRYAPARMTCDGFLPHKQG